MTVLLLALAIVAWLAKDALHKYGLVPTTASVAPGPAPGTAAESGTATEPGAAPPPQSPLEAARSLESTVKQLEEKRSGRY